SVAESGQHAGMAAGPPHGVAVHPPDDVAVKLLLDLRFQLFRAEPHVADRFQPALGADLRRLVLVAAVMTEQNAALEVVGQGQVAEAARFDMTASRAMN